MRAILPIIAFGRRPAFPLLAVTLILSPFLTSCGNNSAKFIGHWVGHRELKAQPGTADYLLNSIGKVDLYIYDNGRFDLSDFSIPKSGSVAYDGDKATLTINEIARVDMSRQSQEARDKIVPLEIELQPDGVLSYRDPKGEDPSVVKLKRTETQVKPHP